MNTHISLEKVHDIAHNLASGGIHNAKFGLRPHAEIFKKVLESRGVHADIEEKFGHAPTIDTPKHIRLTKHYHVYPSGVTHKIIGKFV